MANPPFVLSFCLTANPPSFQPLSDSKSSLHSTSSLSDSKSSLCSHLSDSKSLPPHSTSVWQQTLPPHSTSVLTANPPSVLNLCLDSKSSLYSQPLQQTPPSTVNLCRTANPLPPHSTSVSSSTHPLPKTLAGISIIIIPLCLKLIIFDRAFKAQFNFGMVVPYCAQVLNELMHLWEPRSSNCVCRHHSNGFFMAGKQSL